MNVGNGGFYWLWCAAPWAGWQWQGHPFCWPLGAWKPAPCIWSWWAVMQTGVPPMTSLALPLEKKHKTKGPPSTRILARAKNKHRPLFSSWSCLIWRFSCWIPRTRLERGRCLATWFNVSISSWYYQEITESHLIKRHFSVFWFFNPIVHVKNINTQQVASPNLTSPVSWLLLACWATWSARLTSLQRCHGYGASPLKI